MSQKKYVTIIIRTKNSADIIGQVLAGLFSQDFKDFVPYAVDSGSTDDTLKILEKYGVSYDVIDPASYQPGPVLNRAIEKAETPIVAFLNSDTVPLRSDALRNLLKPHEDENVAATFARQAARPDAEPWVIRDYEQAFPAEGLAPDWMHFSLPFASLKKSVWKKHPFYQAAWASEDTEWGNWARKAGYKVIYVPEALVMHSHNYTFKQVWGRKYVEGEADAFIFGAKPSYLSMVKRFISSSLRDIPYYIRESQLLSIPKAIARRLVYQIAWEAGCRLGYKRQRDNDLDVSKGQTTVLATYE